MDEKQTPSASLARCKVCNGYLSLLLQLNADLLQHFPHDQRRLHVFGCRKKQCSKKPGSIRALREVKKGKTTRRSEKQPNQASPAAVAADGPKQDLGSALFGSKSTSSTSNNTNPFSTSTSTARPSSSNPFASLGGASALAAKSPQPPADEIQPPTETFADKLRISQPEQEPTAKQSEQQEPWPEPSAFPAPYPFFYLDADAEALEPEKPDADKAGSSKPQFDTEESGSTGLDKDSFESSLDKTFQKFSDRIAQNPEQILRYEFKGQPLLYSGADGVATRFVVPHGKAGAVRGMPRCEICGSQRVFEMQLVPGLIYELEKDEAMDLEEGMEWGTIIVGSCTNNCGEEGKVIFKEEWVGVQWEERVSRK